MLVKKQPSTCLHQNRKDISIATISSIVSDAKFINELAFFGTNGKPCLVTDDSLDNAHPPEVSQVVEPINNEYPPDHYDPPVEGNDPMFDSSVENHLSNGTGRMILFQSALDSSLTLFSCFQGFLVFWQVSCLYLGGSNPLRLVFPAPFCWIQGWGGRSVLGLLE